VLLRLRGGAADGLVEPGGTLGGRLTLE